MKLLNNKKIVYLYTIKRLTMEEIGKIFNVSCTTIKKRLLVIKLK